MYQLSLTKNINLLLYKKGTEQKEKGSMYHSKHKSRVNGASVEDMPHVEIRQKN